MFYVLLFFYSHSTFLVRFCKVPDARNKCKNKLRCDSILGGTVGIKHLKANYKKKGWNEETSMAETEALVSSKLNPKTTGSHFNWL